MWVPDARVGGCLATTDRNVALARTPRLEVVRTEVVRMGGVAEGGSGPDPDAGGRGCLQAGGTICTNGECEPS